LSAVWPPEIELARALARLEATVTQVRRPGSGVQPDEGTDGSPQLPGANPPSDRLSDRACVEAGA
jgi:hypothetical protein